MAVELGVGYITLVPSAKGITASLQQQLGSPLVAAGRKSGDATSAAFAGTFKKGLSGIQKGLLGTIGVAGIGVGLVKVGESFDNAFNTIARGTGATGQELEGLDKSFKTVLKNGAGSFEQVSTAITKLNQRTGLTGKALEDFAAKEVTVARITKTDVAANLESTTGLFNLYGIAAEQQSDKLDVLFKASQVAGVSVTQLADEMKQAAPTAKILGLSIDQTAAFVAGLDRAGLPASKVMAGLAGAFSKAAKEGKAPLDVIHSLVEEVKRAPTPTAAATIAIQKYGIGARQASTLVAGLRSGTIDLDKSLAGGKGILATAAATGTLSGKLGRLKNEVLVGLEPLATDALGAITRGVELLVPLVTALTDHMNILGPAILVAAGAFAAFKVGLGIQHLISGTVDAFKKLRAAVFESTAATAESVAASSASAAAKVADAAAASAQAVELRQLAQATLAAATADAAASSEGLASSAAAASAATAEAVALRAKATAALQAATAGGVVNKGALATATALGLEASAAEATAATLRDKAAAEIQAAAATNPTSAGAAASALGAEAAAAEATAVALRAKAVAASDAAATGGFVGLSAQSTAVALAAEASAAEATAVALHAKAAAEFEAATASGIVDLSALSAATALGVEAAAAEANAAAMQASAAASLEAAGASKLLALTPVGKVALIAAAAVTLLTVKTKLFSHGQKDAGRETNAFIASLLKEGKTLKDTAGQVLVKAIGDNHKLADAYKDLGVPLRTVTEALSGNKDAIRTVLDAERDKLRSGDLTLDQAVKINESLNKNSKSLRDQKRDFDNSSKAEKELAGQAGSLVVNTVRAALAQDQLRIAARTLTASIINNTDRIRALQEGMLGIFQSAINLRQGLTDIAEKQTAYNKAVAEFGRTAPEAVKAQQDLELAQLGQASGLLQGVDQVTSFAESVSHLTVEQKKLADAQDALKHGKGNFATVQKAAEDVTKAQDIYRNTVKGVAAFVSGPLHAALLVNIGDNANLHHAIANIPGRKTVTYLTPGLPEATLSTHNFRGELDDLKSKRVSVTMNIDGALSALAALKKQIDALPSNVPFSAIVRAEGGRIPGGKAKGGPVKAGEQYLVGERGVELLRLYAGGGGFVVSNEKLRSKGIPELAQGGVFKKPTLAVVGEDTKTTPEIVSPVKLMAETFRSVLEKTISKTTIVQSTEKSDTTITADAAQAVKTVRGYLVELAKMPQSVTTKIEADTGQAVSGFTHLVTAVADSRDPFEQTSTHLRDIGAETFRLGKRFEESSKAVRDVSGRFALTHIQPAAPVISPASRLTQNFGDDLQKHDTRSIIGVGHQEIHVDRQSFVEEINVANQKLGMRVAIAGRR